MRVALVASDWPYPPVTGERVIVWNLLRFLQPVHEMRLVVLSHEPEPAGLLNQLGTTSVTHIRRREARLLVKHLFNTAYRYPLSVHAITTEVVGKQLELALVGFRPDVVQVCSPRLALYYPHVPRPRVLLAMDCISMLMGRLKQQRSLVARLHYSNTEKRARCLEREVYPKFDAVVLVSDVDAEVVRRISPGARVHVINNGVDTDYFSPIGPSEENEKPVVGMVGNLEYALNVQAAEVLLRDIVPALRSKVPDLGVLIIGNNPPPHLRRLAQTCGPCCTVDGPVQDTRPYLGRMSVFVAFLAAGAGIKNKVLEAMSMGLPVVGTPVAFEGIRGRDGQHFVVARTVRDAVEAIGRLLADPGYRAMIGAEARRLMCEQYSWSAKAQEYEQLWSGLTAARATNT